MLGSPGPDQGYALKLVHQFDGRIHLADGEDIHDVEAGAVAVAMRRSSIFGRAPVIHDLTIAFTVFGFLDKNPPAELVNVRKKLFSGVHIPVHYVEMRTLVDTVSEDALRMTPPKRSPPPTKTTGKPNCSNSGRAARTPLSPRGLARRLR